MRLLGKIVLGILLIVVVIVVFKVVTSYSNIEKESLDLEFPPDTLESCQKQRVILLDSIKQLEGKLNG